MDGALPLEKPSHLSLMSEAEGFSSLNSEMIGTRSLDVLPVAAAVVLGDSVFLTFDLRQAALANAGGLTVPAV